MRQPCCLVTHQQLPLGPCWGRNVDGPPSFPAISSLQLHIQPTVPMRAPGLSVDSGQVAIALGGPRWAGSCIQKLYCILYTSKAHCVRIRIVRYYKFIIYKPVRTRMDGDAFVTWHVCWVMSPFTSGDEWCSNCKATRWSEPPWGKHSNRAKAKVMATNFLSVIYHSSLDIQRIPLWKHPISEGHLIQVATQNYHMFETVAHRPWKSFNSGNPTCSDVINLSRFCLEGCNVCVANLNDSQICYRCPLQKLGLINLVASHTSTHLRQISSLRVLICNLSFMSSSIALRQRRKFEKKNPVSLDSLPNKN